MPQPFIKFYFRDWEGDAQLMACSLEARGLWLHMMRVMHEADPYGFFVGRGGAPIDLSAWAKQIGVALRTLRSRLKELEQNNVFSRDSEGRIFSRRLVRDHARSLQGSEFGRMGGGNPALKAEAIRPPLKHDYNTTVYSGGFKPSRDITQKLRSSDSDSLRSSAEEFGEWPQDVEHLRSLAMLFVAEFANCRDAVKAEKHAGPYTATLAVMRSRSVTIRQAWKACEDAREACGGRPLWGAAVKSALSFLPSRSRAAAPSADDYFRRNDIKDAG